MKYTGVAYKVKNKLGQDVVLTFTETEKIDEIERRKHLFIKIQAKNIITGSVKERYTDVNYNYCMHNWDITKYAHYYISVIWYDSLIMGYETSKKEF